MTVEMDYDTDTGDVSINGEYVFCMFRKQHEVAEFVKEQAEKIEALQLKIDNINAAVYNLIDQF